MFWTRRQRIGFLPRRALGTTQALVSVDALQEFSSAGFHILGRIRTQSLAASLRFETKSGTNQWHGTAYDYFAEPASSMPRTGSITTSVCRNRPLSRMTSAAQSAVLSEFPSCTTERTKPSFFVSYEGLRLTAPQPATVSVVPSASLRASAPAPLKQALNAFPLPQPQRAGFWRWARLNSSQVWSNPSSFEFHERPVRPRDSTIN